MHPLIEVCVESGEAANIAFQAGADRLELNAELRLDGLTPPANLCALVKRDCAVPLIAMVRPHAQGFFYDSDARQQIWLDLEDMLAADVDGIAFGALTVSNTIDTALLARIRARCSNVELVMHRAFDLVLDQQQGLRELIDLGVDRVLTSGNGPTAEAGVSRLQNLVAWSQGQIEILPGGGVRIENAQHILNVTGCTQLHGTFKQFDHHRNLPDPRIIARLKELLTSDKTPRT